MLFYANLKFLRQSLHLVLLLLENLSIYMYVDRVDRDIERDIDCDGDGSDEPSVHFYVIHG